MVSRVMPASGPVSRRSSPIRRLISVDLPTFGPADHRDADRTIGISRRPSPSSSSVGRGVLGQRGADRVIEIGQSFAVLGRNRNRIAKAEFVGFGRARARRAPSLLLATTITGLPARAHDVGELPVDRRQAGAHVHQEQDRVGAFNRSLGLLHHAADQAVAARPRRSPRYRPP